MDIIKLNVGGNIFMTNKDTLCQTVFFQKMFENEQLLKKIDGSYFLDEDPKYFVHILNKLRYPSYKLPKDIDDHIFVVADIYGVHFDDDYKIVVLSRRFNDRDYINCVDFSINGEIVGLRFNCGRDFKCVKILAISGTGIDRSIVKILDNDVKIEYPEIINIEDMNAFNISRTSIYDSSYYQYGSPYSQYILKKSFIEHINKYPGKINEIRFITEPAFILELDLFVLEKC
jgi:hypothetical protein